MAPVAQSAAPADDWVDATPPTKVASVASEADWVDDPLSDPNSVASHAALNLRNNRRTGMLPPPPPAPLPTMDAFFTGVGRGAVSTGTQIGKFVRGATTGDFGPYSDPAVEEQLHGSSPTSIDPQGGADSAGFYSEKIAELLAPAGLASRGAKTVAAGADLVAPSGRVLAEIPAVTGRLGRAAIAGGAEGLSNAAVTGLQTGDPHAAAWAGALGALTAVPLKYWAKAERVKALIGGIVDPALAKPSAEAGAFVQKALGDARDAAGQALGTEYSKIANAATEKVSVGQSLPRIQQLISELEDPAKTFPGLGSVDDVSKALGILKSFAEPGAEVSVADAIKVRSLLFKLSNAGNIGIGKGALQQLTQEWHGEIVNALSKQDPALAAQFNRASSQYRQFINTFNSQTIRTLIRKGAPERVLDVLMSGSGETTATNLRQMIGAQNMETVRSSLWERLLQKSSPGDSTFLAPKFDGMLDKLSPEAQTAIFGSEQNVVRMRKFAAMMDTSWMHEAAHQSIGKTVIKAGAGAAAGIGADRVLEHDGAGGWKVWGPSGAMMALAPALVAKVLARPGTIDVLEKAMTVSPASEAGKVVANKLASLVMGAEMRGGQGEQQGASRSGAPDTQGVLATLEQGDAARRARAGANSALISGPPMPATYPRRPGTQVEFPLTGDRDENDAMLMRRTDAQGKPLQFPIPIPPSKLLPAHFKNARNANYGAPLSGDIGNGELGLYGKKFENGPQTQTENNVLIARNATEEPGTWAHEINHAVFQKDLTLEQKQQFRAKVVSSINAGIADKSVLPTIPKTVIAYANTYPKDHERAFNEIFAELGAQYMLNPSAFKEHYPDWYGMFRKFYGGKEYINGNSNSRPSGALTPGNIDIHSRPTVSNPDGSISTVLSKSFNIDGKEILLPTISDAGRRLSDREAVDLYRETGRHLGVFASPSAATEYAQWLHRQQAREYGSSSSGSSSAHLKQYNP